MMQKRIPLIAMFCCCYALVQSQYYYNDILLRQTAAANHSRLVQNRITSITATGYDGDNIANDNFSYEKMIKKNGAEIFTVTLMPASGKTYSREYYELASLQKSVDSSEKIVTTTQFTYNTNNLPASIQMNYDDAFMDIHAKEQHLWMYQDKTPERMYRIKDNSDTMLVLFTADATGKVIEEAWQRDGREVERYYYYYNDNNQLSDIVRFNILGKRLLPDFTFDYNSAGDIINMRQIIAGGTDYNSWLYTFDERGLKQSEKFYNKQSQLIGMILYSYK